MIQAHGQIIQFPQPPPPALDPLARNIACGLGALCFPARGCFTVMFHGPVKPDGETKRAVALGDDKWGQAVAIPLAPGQWVVMGWASS